MPTPGENRFRSAAASARSRAAAVALRRWLAQVPARRFHSDPREVLLRRFSGWHHPISEIVEATPPQSLIVNRIYDRRPPQKLQRGPVLLVGDAAHAMTPDLGHGTFALRGRHPRPPDPIGPEVINNRRLAVYASATALGHRLEQ